MNLSEISNISKTPTRLSVAWRHSGCSIGNRKGQQPLLISASLSAYASSHVTLWSLANHNSCPQMVVYIALQGHSAWHCQRHRGTQLCPLHQTLDWHSYLHLLTASSHLIATHSTKLARAAPSTSRVNTIPMPSRPTALVRCQSYYLRIWC